MGKIGFKKLGADSNRRARVRCNFDPQKILYIITTSAIPKYGYCEVADVKPHEFDLVVYEL
jgi:hypothetical protein